MPRIDLVFIGLITFMGLLMVITNKPYFIGTEKYTEESLKKYPRPAGTAMILFGVFIFATLYSIRLLGEDKISGWVAVACLVAAVISIIALIIIRKKTLVKR